MKLMTRTYLLLIALTLISVNAEAKWYCNVADKEGHVWASSGETQDRANTVALSFCTAYSPHSSTCELSHCYEDS